MKRIWRLIRFVDQCVYCGREGRSNDHVRPRNRGGNDPDNIVPACTQCNIGKCSKLLTEWDAVRVGRVGSQDRRVRMEWDRLVLMQQFNPLIDRTMRQSPGIIRARKSDDVLLSYQRLEWSTHCVAREAARFSREYCQSDNHSLSIVIPDPFPFFVKELWERDRATRQNGAGSWMRASSWALDILIIFTLSVRSPDNDNKFRAPTFTEIIDELSIVWPGEIDPKFVHLAETKGLRRLAWEEGIL